MNVERITTALSRLRETAAVTAEQQEAAAVQCLAELEHVVTLYAAIEHYNGVFL